MAQRTGEPPQQPDDYRLDRFDVEQRGRWREFTRSLLLLTALFLLQVPLRRVAEGYNPPSIYDFPASTSLRISLLIDGLMIYAYWVVAFRAWGLVRSYRPPTLVRTSTRLAAYYLIPAGAALDVAENVVLWQRADQKTRLDSITLPFTPLMLVLVVAGLVVTVGWAVVANPYRWWRRDGAGTAPRRTTRVAGRLLEQPRARRLADRLLPRAEVARWRARLELAAPAAPCDDEERGDPAAYERPHSVICCSGGGVRSAAFSLGGLQALNQAGVYGEAEAVVGVSGGGYTSTALHVTRWLSDGSERPGGEQPDGEPRWVVAPQEAFTPDSPEQQWLRRHTHYVLDSVRVATQGALSLALGIAVNLFLAAIAIGSVAWYLAWQFRASGRILRWSSGSGIDGQVATYWAWVDRLWWLPLAGAIVFVLERAVERFHTLRHTTRASMRALAMALIWGGLAAVALVQGLPALIVALHDYAATSKSVYADLIHALGIVPDEVCNQVLARGKDACGVAGDATTAGSSAPARVGAVSLLTVITSVLAVLGAVRGASKADGSGSGVGGLLKKVWAKIKDPLVPWLAAAAVALVLLVQLVRWTAVLATDPERLDDWRWPALAALGFVVLKVFFEPNRTSLHHFFRERISFAFLVRRWRGKIVPVPYRRPLRFSRSAPPTPQDGPRLVTCAVANVSDPTVVPSQRGCTPFVFDDGHIGLTDRMLPVAASRRPAATYEFAADHRFRDATIPAGVAMSAAAFSPLAGRENVRLGPYRAVLALANARLGVWLPNPVWVDYDKVAWRLLRLRNHDDFGTTWRAMPCRDAHEMFTECDDADRTWIAWAAQRGAADGAHTHALVWASATEDGAAAAAMKAPAWADTLECLRSVVKKPGVTRVVREAVGRASIYDRFLYVTDGGHYDNLGLIEALRRRPRRVYVLDASNDPEDTFRALGLAVATARMDLDCELVLDPRPMRRLEEQRSAAAAAVGVATYADGKQCAVYLVKAIMLDDLSWDVETYAAANADFPRTSTTKQLYSELDFEAYRMLGSRSVEQLLGSEQYAALEAQLEHAAQLAVVAAEAARRAAEAARQLAEAEGALTLAREVLAGAEGSERAAAEQLVRTAEKAVSNAKGRVTRTRREADEAAETAEAADTAASPVHL